jgi:hypothetical protein
VPSNDHDRHSVAVRGCAECRTKSQQLLAAESAQEPPDGALTVLEAPGTGFRSVGAALATPSKGFPIPEPPQQALIPDGMAPDGLPPCERCGSQRNVRPEGWSHDLPVSHPLFGQFAPCPDCTAGRVLEKRIARYWITAPERIRDYTLDGLAKMSPEHAKFVRKLRVWLELAYQPWLLLFGPWGCGKTGAAGGLAREVMASGGTSVLAVVPDMLGWLRETYSGEGDEKAVLDDLRMCDLLVLDDLGKHYQTGWAADRIFQVLNYRYNANKRTIVTCNEEPDALGARLNMQAEMSRIRELAGRGDWVLDCRDLPNLRERPAA